MHIFSPQKNIERVINPLEHEMPMATHLLDMESFKKTTL